jgi:hypothetical protein
MYTYIFVSHTSVRLFAIGESQLELLSFLGESQLELLSLEKMFEHNSQIVK